MSDSKDEEPSQWCSDAIILFSCRCLRMFSYGAVALILYIFLLNEYSSSDVAVLLTSIMVGDFIMTLLISSRADKQWGRKTSLCLGCVLKVFAGVGYAVFPDKYWVLLVCGTVGVITPTGGEIGPFLNIEQAALSDLGARGDLHGLSYTLAWYAAAGGLSAALGAGSAGAGIHLIQGLLEQKEAALFPTSVSNTTAPTSVGAASWSGFFSSSSSVSVDTEATRWLILQSYRWVFATYALIALIMLYLYSRLSPHVEPPTRELDADPREMTVYSGQPSATGSDDDNDEGNIAQDNLNIGNKIFLHLFGLRSIEHHYTIATMSWLFALDAFAGALVLQSYLALWMQRRWGISEEQLGFMLLIVNTIGGLSGFVSSWLVRRIGAIATMVFTHLPSNVLLFLVPLMPTEHSSLNMLYARYCISQMDVPARQAYVTTVVPSAERSAANGITNSARTVGVALAPLLLKTFLSSAARMDYPFYAAATLKIIYDISLYYLFKNAESQKSEHVESKPKGKPSERTPLTAGQQKGSVKPVENRVAYGSTTQGRGGGGVRK